MIAKIIDGKTIEVYDLTQFDADAIMHSGQVFRYFKTDTGYLLIAGKNMAEIAVKDNKVIIKSNDSAYFYNYFDLDTDYTEIKNSLLDFEKLKPAITAGGGIRILRAEFIETVISFIISANNNIKRFTKTLNLLAEQYGDKLYNGYYAFPTIRQLETAAEEDFKKAGCGYRSPYLVKTVRQLGGFNTDELSLLDDKSILKELMRLPGIGQKVASCIGLFSSVLPNKMRFRVCPIDVHIRKAIEQLGSISADEIINHRYAGIAQQYIFYYLQHLHKEL